MRGTGDFDLTGALSLYRVSMTRYIHFGIRDAAALSLLDGRCCSIDSHFTNEFVYIYQSVSAGVCLRCMPILRRNYDFLCINIYDCECIELAHFHIIL